MRGGERLTYEVREQALYRLLTTCTNLTFRDVVVLRTRSRLYFGIRHYEALCENSSR